MPKASPYSRRNKGKARKRGFGKSLIMKPRKPIIYNFTRNTVTEITLDQPFTLPVAFSSNEGANGYFSLNDLPNVTEFTNLFDAYRLMGVKMSFIWNANVVNFVQQTTAGTLTNNFGIPILYWAPDHDDGGFTTTLNELRQYSGFRQRRMDRPITIFVRPRTSSSVYKGALASAYKENNRKTWIDAANPDVQYFAIKWAIDKNCPGANDQDIIGHVTLEMKYYFQCKDPR